MSGIQRAVPRGAWSYLVALQVIAFAVHAQDSLPVRELDRTEPVEFEREILPILRSNCLACHSASAAEGDLVLESPATIAEGGLTGAAVVAGNSEESLLFQAAAHAADVVMPPAGNAVGAENLTPEELGLLALWIDQGALAGGSVDKASLKWRALPAGLDPIYAVAVTPDGRYAAAGRGNRLFVYQIATQRLVGELVDASLAEESITTRATSVAVEAAHLDLVQSLGFSPDGGRLASGGFRTVKIWRKLPPVVTRGEHADGYESAGAVAASSPLATWQANIVQLKEALDGAVVRAFDLGRPVSFAAVAPDASRVVALGASGPGKMWNAESGAVVAELHADVALREQLAEAAFQLTVRERQRDQAQRDLDAANRRKQEAEETLAAALKELQTAETALAESQKLVEEKVAAGGAEADAAKAQRVAAERNVAAAKDAISLNEPLVRRAQEEANAAETALQEAQENVAAAVDRQDRLRKELEAIRIEVVAAAFSPDSATIAFVDGGGTVQTFAAADGSPLERFPRCVEKPTGIRYVAADRVRIDTAEAVCEVVTLPDWELERTIGTWDDPRILADRVTALDFSPDGKLLAAGSGEPSRTGEIHLFDVETGSPVTEVEEVHSDTVLSLAFSPDGKQLAAGGADRFARIFDVADGRLLRNLEGHTGHVAAVAWHADGRTLATASADGTVKVWDSHSGEQLKTIDGSGGPLSDVAFLGAEDLFVASGGKNSLAARKTDGSGGPNFGGASNFFHAVSVPLDGRLVVAGGEGGALRVWRKDGGAVAVLAPE